MTTEVEIVVILFEDVEGATNQGIQPLEAEKDGNEFSPYSLQKETGWPTPSL